jgi:DNA-binding CsgD family transcriptional regulator/tetratricopeptide (TPR) repeat protein
MPAAGPAKELLERSAQLSALEQHLGAVTERAHGRFVLIRGEAGVGKTALLRRFCDDHRQSRRILLGACDALFTPRPLGVFVDIGQTTGGELDQVIEGGGKPHEVATALMRELRTQVPTILVLEDLHWVDEASIDVLRLLSRRIEAVPALVLASYRDDSLDRFHPLRFLVGELPAGDSVAYVNLAPLSRVAVAELAQPREIDVDRLYRETGGNPFFVTEVLAGGNGSIPNTVRDAVLARAVRLTPAARGLLDAVAIAPQQAELWLLESLVPDALGDLEECLVSGMLSPTPGGVAFRHELARLAIEESLPPHRRLALHRQALAALSAAPASASDLDRLAYHAEAAADTQAVLRLAPAAGQRAASMGAHRQAAAFYTTALRFADDLPLAERADLLFRRSHECYLIDHYDQALADLENAGEHYRRLGDRRHEGEALTSLSKILWCPGRTAEAEVAGRQAVAVLEGITPGRELALAYSTLSAIYKDAERSDEALAWGTRGLELAERLGETEALVHSLTNIGAMEWLKGAPRGRYKVEEARALAEAAGLHEQAARALFQLAWVAVRDRSHVLANGYLDAGLRYCSDRGIELWRLYLLAYRARSKLDQGLWAEVATPVQLVLRVPRTSTTPRIIALVALGLVQARRGDPDVWPLLDEAHALAEPSGELQRIGPVAAARAEAAWLEGNGKAVGQATESALELAVERQTTWVIGELASWRLRAGIDDHIIGAAAPYALQLAGDWAGAGRLWTELGCPYEAALALSEADDEDSLRRALDELQRMGARPAASIVARRLRERGARALPRGPRPETRENPANLTARELEVLALVAQGLRNSEMAERLYLSEKTVGHHVSAILQKLGVSTRGQAGAEASRLGLVGEDPSRSSLRERRGNPG